MKLAVVAVAIATACGSSPPPPSSPAPMAMPAASDPTCPIEVAGTSVSVEDATRGAAFVFVTTGDATAVAAVRERARTFAASHDKHAGPDSSFAQMVAGSATTAASDIEHGAKVTFTAVKDDDVGALQSELRMHAEHLGGGNCKMSM